MQISSLLKPEQIKLELAQTKRCNAINEVAQQSRDSAAIRDCRKRIVARTDFHPYECLT